MQTQTRKLVMASIAPKSLPGPAPLPFHTALALSLVTAALLWASFFPLNAGWCAWFALVPMLLLVRAPGSAWRAAVAVFLGGYGFYIVSMEWIRIADPRMYASWIALSFYCALFFPLTLWLLRRLDRLRLPLTLTVPLIWTPLEYFRAHFLTGFAWYFLGHAQHDFLAVVQVTDVTGVYGVSFLVAAVNGMIAEWTFRVPAVRRLMRMPAEPPPRPIVQTTVVVGLLFAVLGYGAWRLGQDQFEQGPRVAILQSNFDQRLKNSRHLGSEEGIGATEYMYDRMCALTLQAVKTGGIDLMIWPETACPYDWRELAPDAPEEMHNAETNDWLANRRLMAREIAHNSQAHVLLGINTIEATTFERFRRYNSALLIAEDGRMLDRYDKIHCVPFGEYVPMRETLPWMSRFAPYDFDYSLTSGARWTRFELATRRRAFHFAAIICYEDSDPLLARRYVRDEGPDRPPVDFLVNMSNDGWFDGHFEHEQHLAICRFRALECRRAVVRSVNMGVSAVIDGNGRVVALPAASWRESKKVAAVVVADVPIDRRVSWYARLGDWFPAAISVLAVLGLALTLGAKKKN